MKAKPKIKAASQKRILLNKFFQKTNYSVGWGWEDITEENGRPGEKTEKRSQLSEGEY